MKALTRYAPDVSYATMAEDTTHIIVPLEVHELTKSFAADFYGVLDDIHATAKEEEALSFAVFRAESFVLSIDRGIDLFVPPLLNAVLASVGNNKEHPFYVFLVGDQTIGEICDPVLGVELETVRAWIAPLQAFSDPIVQTYGNRLASCALAADDAGSSPTSPSPRGSRRSWTTSASPPWPFPSHAPGTTEDAA